MTMIGTVILFKSLFKRFEDGESSIQIKGMKITLEFHAEPK